MTKQEETKPKDIVKVDKPLAPAQSQVVQLSQSNPEEVVNKATMIAKMLTPIIVKNGLFVDIHGKKYVKAEGWASMLAMLGIFPQVEWTKKIERQDEIAYEARVVLKSNNGTIVGSAEAMCSSRESNWSGKDEFSIRSMAQTRAVGKAARLPFAWIMTLSGYDGTPAEEMPPTDNQNSNKQNYQNYNRPQVVRPANNQSAVRNSNVASESQKGYIIKLISLKKCTEQQFVQKFGNSNLETFDTKKASEAIEWLKSLPNPVVSTPASNSGRPVGNA